MNALLLALGAALILSLLLAAAFTPAHWWRRPTLGNLSLTGLCTWAISSALLAWLGPASLPASPAAAAPLVQHARAPAPLQEQSFRVREALNLRSGPGTDQPRLATIAAGTLIVRTGARQGDWWQVRVGANTGWSNSLWLRRPGEP